MKMARENEHHPVAEALQWPEPEPEGILGFQRSLWELASAVSAEHALSMPVDRRKDGARPAVPAYEPEWLDEATAITPASAPIEAPHAEAELPVKFGPACDSLDDLIAQLDIVTKKKD
jgi:hypothetical protein